MSYHTTRWECLTQRYLTLQARLAIFQWANGDAQRIATVMARCPEFHRAPGWVCRYGLAQAIAEHCAEHDD